VALQSAARSGQEELPRAAEPQPRRKPLQTEVRNWRVVHRQPAEELRLRGALQQPAAFRRTEALQPEALQPEALQPEALQPEALQPEALQPEAL
jgi:hypothetical protein